MLPVYNLHLLLAACTSWERSNQKHKQNEIFLWQHIGSSKSESTKTLCFMAKLLPLRHFSCLKTGQVFLYGSKPSSTAKSVLQNSESCWPQCCIQGLQKFHPTCQSFVNMPCKWQYCQRERNQADGADMSHGRNWNQPQDTHSSRSQ